MGQMRGVGMYESIWAMVSYTNVDIECMIVGSTDWDIALLATFSYTHPLR
jgi:hypothetical protein